eukprot:1755114-Alexandrium_andersonii.AAC.1
MRRSRWRRTAHVAEQNAHCAKRAKQERGLECVHQELEHAKVEAETGVRDRCSRNHRGDCPPSTPPEE